MNDLLFFLAAALVLFGLLFVAAALTAERGIHHGARFFRRTN
jgi:hypothetical protein